MRRISIFGATGSVGENTFDLVMRQGGPEAYHTVALSGGANIVRLAEQAVALRAEIAITAFDAHLPALREALAGTGIETAAGPEALVEAAARPTDWTMSAIVGAAGLAPGLKSMDSGGILALANKESLVSAGPLIMGEADRLGCKILPVDSEHSAIFQALKGEAISSVSRIVLTASGGPFLDWSADRIARATPTEAVAHPNWTMGQRISVDSASMFNKAMEVIETKEFFGASSDQIEVIIHPQSIIHSLVEFHDGAMLAHLGAPDMRGAVGYALNWPDRAPLPLDRLDLGALARLDFQTPDEEKFPALRLARYVMQLGGLAGATFTAAKEAALDGFLAHELSFPAMAEVVETVLNDADRAGDLKTTTIDLDTVLAADKAARQRTKDAIALKQAS